jgi:alpha-1,2-mannosyltransferase
MRTLLFVVVASAFVLVNAVNAIRKGGDFTTFLDAGNRFLDGVSLYAGSSVGAGVVWPPFTGAFFSPFALVARTDPRLARVAWYVLNLVALGAAIRAWTAVLGPLTGRAIRWRAWRAEPYGPVLLALVGIAFPLQTNFEHQNMNVVLLALIGLAAWAVARERDTTAGLWIGVATALKAFPALLLVYLAVRQRWRAFAAGVIAAGALTLLSALRFEPDVATTIRDWLDINARGSWPVRGNNQSLFALLARAFGPAEVIQTGHVPSATYPGIHLAWMAIALSLATVTLIATGPWRIRSERATPIGLVPVLALAVLLSPIAWDHYWVLMFPAFLFLALSRDRAAWVPWVFWVAAILTSGFSRATVGVQGLSVARTLSVVTWGGLVLLAATLILQRGSVADRGAGVRDP